PTAGGRASPRAGEPQNITARGDARPPAPFAAGRKNGLQCQVCGLVFPARGALSSVVEHFLHTEGVAGSNPAARTILPIPFTVQASCPLCPGARLAAIVS